MGWKTVTTFAVACSAISFLLFDAVPAISQQPTGRGGGFTQPEPIDFEGHAGWTSLFDGQTLNGWDGDKNYWRVQDGAIVVESTCEKPTGTIYLIWQGGEPADFEMKLEMKGEEAAVNSGVQYRGAITDPNRPRGGGGGRGAQGPCPSGAPRGTPPSPASQAKWEQGKKPRLLATLGDKDELAGYVHIENFNQLHIIARGNIMTHIVNGHVMSILIDDDPTKFRKSGLIGFEVEGTGKISIRNIWLKKL